MKPSSLSLPSPTRGQGVGSVPNRRSPAASAAVRGGGGRNGTRGHADFTSAVTVGLNFFLAMSVKTEFFVRMFPLDPTLDCRKTALD